MKNDKSRLLLFMSIILFTLLIFSAPVRSEEPAPSFKEYSSTGDYFTCSIPADWSVETQQRTRKTGNRISLERITLLPDKIVVVCQWRLNLSSPWFILVRRDAWHSKG